MKRLVWNKAVVGNSYANSLASSNNNITTSSASSLHQKNNDTQRPSSATINVTSPLPSATGAEGISSSASQPSLHSPSLTNSVGASTTTSNVDQNSSSPQRSQERNILVTQTTTTTTTSTTTTSPSISTSPASASVQAPVVSSSILNRNRTHNSLTSSLSGSAVAVAAAIASSSSTLAAAVTSSVSGRGNPSNIAASASTTGANTTINNNNNSNTINTSSSDIPFNGFPSIKNHTATLVGKKQIYVIGGYDGRRNHNTVHVIQALDNGEYSWNVLDAKGDVPDGRNGHTSTLVELECITAPLSPGEQSQSKLQRRIYVIGGWLGRGPFAADDLYYLDLDTNYWIRPKTNGEPPGPCNMHTTEYIPAIQQLLVFRGGDGKDYLNDLHAFDVTTMTWSKPVTYGTTPVKRANHASASVGSKMFIFGGWDGKIRLNDIHMLDALSMTWTNLVVNGIPPSPRAGMSFISVNDKIFLFGGSGPKAMCFNDLQVFDTLTASWLDVISEDQNSGNAKGNSNTDGLIERNKKHYVSSASTSSITADMERVSLKSPMNDRSAVNFDQADLCLAPLQANSSSAASTASSSVHMPGNIENPNSQSTAQSLCYLLYGTGPGRRAGHTATLIDNRRLLVIGGSFGSEYLCDFFELDTDPVPVVRITMQSPTSLFQRGLRSALFDPQFSDVTFIVEGRPVYAHRVIVTLLSDRFRGMLQGSFREAKQKEIIIPDVRYDLFTQMMEYLYTGEVPPAIKMISSLTQNQILENVNSLGISASSSSLPSSSSEDVSSTCNADGQSTGYGMAALDPNNTEENSQLGDYQIVEEIMEHNLSSIADLLEISDQFMLDHLKELCESALQGAVNSKNVFAILELAERHNAYQLREVCEHFIRYDPVARRLVES